jgi:hypothetical protein
LLSSAIREIGPYGWRRRALVSRVIGDVIDEVPPDSAADLRRLRSARPALLRRFHAQRRRGGPEAGATLLALDPVLVIDAPPSTYRRQLEATLEDAHEPQLAAGLLRAQARFWSIRGAQHTARAAIARARALVPDEPIEQPFYAGLLDFIGVHAAHALGDVDEVAAAEVRIARRTASALGPARLRLGALASMTSGILALLRGRHAAALDAFAEAADWARRADADRTLAIAIANQGICSLAMDAPDEAALRKARALFREVGDELHALQMSALLLAAGRDRVDAREAFALARASAARGDDRNAAEVLLALVERGDRSAARRDGARVLERAWAHLGRVDAPELEARAARLSQGDPAATLEAQPDGLALRVGGRRIDLRSRKALPNVVRALLGARLEQPGARLSVSALFEAGWPGERAMPHAAAARVYMAVRLLRALGLRDMLGSHVEGYRIEPEVEIRLVPSIR